MLDSTTIFDPGFRVTDANGDPVSGAKIKVYLSGTSTPTTVYADSALTVSLGSTVTCDSAGYPTTDGSTKTLVWMGTSAIKVVLTDANDATIATHDGITGAIATSQLGGSSSGLWTTSTTSSSDENLTLTTNDLGKLHSVNPPSGGSTRVIPSAITAGAGSRIGFRHSGTANQVKIASVSGQTIYLPGGQSTVGFSLADPGQVAWLVSDGANWTADIATRPFGRGGIIPVVSRLTAEPSGPTPGAIYMVSGTPTGSWSSAGYAANDLLEADGQGGWIRRTPTADCGWIAYVQDGNTNYQYQDSAWTAWDVSAPAATYQKHMILQYQQPNGTNGGQAVTGSRQTYPQGSTNPSQALTFVNSGSSNAISGATLTTATISGLPVGWYKIEGEAVFSSTDSTQLFFRNSSTSTDLVAGPTVSFGNATAFRGTIPLAGVFQVTDATHNYVIQYEVAGTGGGTPALGTATSFTDGVEIYGTFIITDLGMSQGPQGATGTQGATGRDAGMGRWTFSTTTTSGAASGTFRFNNATIASATALYINETDADSNSLAPTIQSWDDSTSTIKGYLTFRKQGTPATWAQFAVTGSIVDNGSDDTVTISYVTGNGSFSASDSVLVSFSRTGDQGPAGSNGTNGTNGSNGATGATGAAGPSPIDYTWDTGTTAADPGSGKLRANNATLSSAMAIYINETDRLGNNLATYIQTWDDSTSTAKGVLEIVDTATPANRAYFSVTGSVTDNGTYDTLTVSYLSGVTSFSAGNVALLFYRTGDKGADGAGTGDVSSSSNFTADNRLVRTDRPTTDNKNVQQSGITIDDSNNVSGVGTLASGATTVTSASSTALAIGANGTTNPVLQVDSATASVATGIKITGAAAASRVAFAAISSGTDEGLSIDAKGAGTIRLGATSTGQIEFSRNAVPTSSDGAALGTTSLMWSDLFLATGAVINWNNGAVALTHSGTTLTLTGLTSWSFGTSGVVTLGTVELGAATDTTLSRVSAGVMSVEGATVATLSTAQTWTKHQGVSVATLTDGATISWDVSTGQKAKVTLGGNRTMNAVTNAVDGYTYTLEIFQDGTGSRLISTWTTTGSGSFDFGTAGAPTLTTTASKADILCFEAVTIGGTLKLRYLGAALGFA